MIDQAELFEYGVQNEKSDIRAHVAVLAKKIYIYRTKEAVSLLNSGKYSLKPAYQEGVQGPTALGAPVPIKDFRDLRTVTWNGCPYWDGWHEKLSTSQKGKKAIEVVVDLLKYGRFPLWIEVEEDKRQNIQIKGTDIVVFCKQHIQVKCDYRAGEGHELCTGNLYLQTKERNPLKRI